MNYRQTSGCGCNMNRQNFNAAPIQRSVQQYTGDNTINAECIDSLPLVMAYVPMQTFRDLYDPESGLTHGTIFRELDLPFHGGMNCSNMQRGRNY